MRLENQKGDPPVCADCTYSRAFDATGLTCVHPNNSHFDFVKGRQPVPCKSARAARSNEKGCGMTGRYFVVRKPEPRWPHMMFFTIVAIAAASYLTKGWLW